MTEEKIEKSKKARDKFVCKIFEVIDEANLQIGQIVACLISISHNIAKSGNSKEAIPLMRKIIDLIEQEENKPS